jgi:hypothetical protein
MTESSLRVVPALPAWKQMTKQQPPYRDPTATAQGYNSGGRAVTENYGLAAERQQYRRFADFLPLLTHHRPTS